ncbi:MAG: rhodanese-like domain-containing protein [Egibacteraceae bacterium]
MSYRRVDVGEFAAAARDGAQVLDVSSPAEWESGRVPGAVLCCLPDLVASAPPELRRDRPVWVACTSGYRASIAAGLLERHGFTPVVLSQGGIPDVVDQLS